MKQDWKGNSNTVCSRLGIQKDHTTRGREQDDFYATDPEALRKLLDSASNELTIELWQTLKYKDCIWECAFNVYASDLKNRGYGYMDMDFLKEKMIRDCCVILTNPPYSLANEFILHALDILPEGGLYIALMNINCLAGIERYNKIFSKGSLREIYVFSKRIGCWKNGERDDKKAHIINYAWYVFQKGYKGQPTLYWL